MPRERQDTTNVLYSFELRDAFLWVIRLEHSSGVVTELEPEELSTELHLVQEA